MPYTNKNMPGWVKEKLPLKAQSIWIATWNNAAKKFKDEKKAFKIAISAVKNAGYKKDDKIDKYILMSKSSSSRFVESYKKMSKSSQDKCKGDGKMKKEETSKFASDSVDTIKAIVQKLKELAQNKKPEDEIAISVKSISLLIQDLEGVAVKEVTEEESKDGEEETEEDKPEEKTEEKSEEETGEEATSEKSSEEDKPEEKPEDKVSDSEEKEDEKNEEPKTEDKGDEPEGEKSTEETPKEDAEETSKFQEMIKLCEGYQAEIKAAQDQVSKYQAEITSLKSERDTLSNEMSKFQQDKYNEVLNKTVDCVSKFKSLSTKETEALRTDYLNKKMSVTALEEIGSMVGGQVTSKWSEEKTSTQPTEFLTSEKKQVTDQEVSKLSASDKLDALANLQAKMKGFVQ